MAKIEDPQERGKVEDLPEQRQGQQEETEEEREEREDRQTGDRKNLPLDKAPTIMVIGFMDGQIAVRLGWRHGMSVVSRSRFRFMKEDLGMAVIDNPENYLV